MTQLVANSISVNVFVCNQNVCPLNNMVPARSSLLRQEVPFFGSTGTLYALSR